MARYGTGYKYGSGVKYGIAVLVLGEFKLVVLYLTELDAIEATLGMKDKMLYCNEPNCVEASLGSDDIVIHYADNLEMVSNV